MPRRVTASLVIACIATWSSSGVSGAPRTGVSIDGRPISAAVIDAALRSCQGEGEARTAACVNEEHVPMWLLDAEIRHRQLATSQHAQALKRSLLFKALANKLHAAAEAPSTQDIAQAVETHRRDFEKPLRLRISRILVRTESEAKELLASLGADTSPEQFREKARDLSVDRATSGRGGELGFVWPDGTTDIPQLRVDPALVVAAQSVPDGALVPAPVPEGDRFAVVWRRGSLPPESANPTKRNALVTARLRAARASAAIDAVIDDASKTVEEHADLLKRLGRPECKIFEQR